MHAISGFMKCCIVLYRYINVMVILTSSDFGNPWSLSLENISWPFIVTSNDSENTYEFLLETADLWELACCFSFIFDSTMARIIGSSESYPKTSCCTIWELPLKGHLSLHICAVWSMIFLCTRGSHGTWPFLRQTMNCTNG